MERYYQLLGVAPDADEKIVRKAYRRQALRYHPDKNSDPAAVDQFRLIKEALEAILASTAAAASTGAGRRDRSTTPRNDPAFTEELKKAAKFREKLFERTTKAASPSPSVSHRRLRDMSLANTRLRRIRTDRPSATCRTLKSGRVFPSVALAREYVDSHAGEQLQDSWFESTYSKKYEHETLLRASRVMR